MDPYAILGIDKTATRDQIVAAYREKVKKYHPDVGGDAWAFRLVQQAYDDLMKGMRGTREPVEPQDGRNSAQQRQTASGTRSGNGASPGSAKPESEPAAERPTGSGETPRRSSKRATAPWWSTPSLAPWWSTPSYAKLSRGMWFACRSFLRVTVHNQGIVVRPWIRFWARLIDTWYVILVMSLILVVVYPSAVEWAHEEEFVVGMILFFAYCFIEPIFFSIFGTTPGKALLGIDVRTRSGNRLSFGEAMKRSFRIWFCGWGMGLPIVPLITLPAAYDNLTARGIATWDRLGDFHVSHRRIGAVRGTIATVLIAGLIVIMRMR